MFDYIDTFATIERGSARCWAISARMSSSYPLSLGRVSAERGQDHLSVAFLFLSLSLFLCASAKGWHVMFDRKSGEIMDKDWRAWKCPCEYTSLKAESAAMGKRRPWFVGIGLISLLVTPKIVRRGRILSEPRHTFGEFSVVMGVLAYGVCVAWGAREYFNDKKMREIGPERYKKLQGFGYEYDSREMYGALHPLLPCSLSVSI